MYYLFGELSDFPSEARICGSTEGAKSPFKKHWLILGLPAYYSDVVVRPGCSIAPSNPMIYVRIPVELDVTNWDIVDPRTRVIVCKGQNGSAEAEFFSCILDLLGNGRCVTYHANVFECFTASTFSPTFF